MLTLLLGVAPAGAPQGDARAARGARSLVADGRGKEVALEALEAAGLLVDTKCHVPQDHIWLVGTNHRTGSLMNNDLLRSIIHHSDADVSREAVTLKTDPLGDGLQRKHGLIIESESGSGLKCIKEVKHGGICLVPHLHLANLTDFQLMRRVALRRKAQLRLVNWVRDPLKVARSAYMYHIRGPADELWLHENNSEVVAAISNACSGSAEIEPPHLTCQGLRSLGKSQHELSYFGLLTKLAASKDHHAAFLTEMWRSNMNGIKQMQSTTQALSNVSSDIAITVDLDQAVASCNQEFQRVFSVLGGQPLDACAKVGCDIATSQCTAPQSKKSSGCGTKSFQHHTSQSKEDVEIAASLEAYARSNYWFKKHVEPVRKGMGYLS
jgi:hypothetical protein|tara:strand:+ start:667 stop:1809 length:1143 start_codon:yes stop_codon:yes gene_type:complete